MFKTLCLKNVFLILFSIYYSKEEGDTLITFYMIMVHLVYLVNNEYLNLKLDNYIH